MDYYFWSNVTDYFKERRVAGMFFALLLFFAGLVLVGVLAYQVMGQNVVYLLPLGVALLLVWAGRALLRARACRLARYHSTPLSDDDLKKARTKLRGVKR